MTMDEVHEFLKKNPKQWFTTRDISKAINRQPQNTSKILRGLLLRKLISIKLDYDNRYVAIFSRKINWWKLNA